MAYIFTAPAMVKKMQDGVMDNDVELWIAVRTNYTKMYIKERKAKAIESSNLVNHFTGGLHFRGSGKSYNALSDANELRKYGIKFNPMTNVVYGDERVSMLLETLREAGEDYKQVIINDEPSDSSGKGSGALRRRKKRIIDTTRKRSIFLFSCAPSYKKGEYNYVFDSWRYAYSDAKYRQKYQISLRADKGIVYNVDLYFQNLIKCYWLMKSDLTPDAKDLTNIFHMFDDVSDLFKEMVACWKAVERYNKVIVYSHDKKRCFGYVVFNPPKMTDVVLYERQKEGYLDSVMLSDTSSVYFIYEDYARKLVYDERFFQQYSNCVKKKERLSLIKKICPKDLMVGGADEEIDTLAVMELKKLVLEGKMKRTDHLIFRCKDITTELNMMMKGSDE